MSTFRVLLRKPGQLTLEGPDRRRALYLSPVALYLLCSCVYFAIAAAAASMTAAPPKAATDSATAATFGETDLASEERDILLSVMEDVPSFWRPLVHRMAVDPAGFDRDLVAAGPKVLFVLAPLFGLILAAFYKRVPLADHMAFALDVHAFTFTVFIAGALAALTTSTILSVIAGALVLIWVPVYWHVAFRTYYRESVAETLIKETAVSLLYTVALIPMMLALLLWESR